MGTESSSLCLWELVFISLFSQLSSWVIMRSEKPFRLSNFTSKTPGCSWPSTSRKNPSEDFYFFLMFCFILWSKTPNIHHAKPMLHNLPKEKEAALLLLAQALEHSSPTCLHETTFQFLPLLEKHLYHSLFDPEFHTRIVWNTATGSQTAPHLIRWLRIWILWLRKQTGGKKKKCSSSHKNHICCILKIYPFH